MSLLFMSQDMAGCLQTLLLLQERETQLGDRPFRLLERSVFSDRMVFVRAVHEAKWMSDLELNIYDSWYAHKLVLHSCQSSIGYGA